MPKIARRGTAHGSGPGRTRWVVEHTFARLHQFKRLRIRYETRADLHQGLLQLACSIICLGRLRTSFWNDQLLKREVLPGRRGWPTARAARLAVFRWLGFYNHRRRHSTIGCLAPVAFEQRSTTLAIAA